MVFYFLLLFSQNFMTFIAGAAVLIVDITFPIASEDDILDKYEQVLQENPNIKLAVLGKKQS